MNSAKTCGVCDETFTAETIKAVGTVLANHYQSHSFLLASVILEEEQMVEEWYRREVMKQIRKDLATKGAKTTTVWRFFRREGTFGVVVQAAAYT